MGPSSTSGESNRARGERFLRRSREPSGSSWGWLLAAFVALLVGVGVLRRRRAAVRRQEASRSIPVETSVAPTLSFRGKDYAPVIEHGEAVWIGQPARGVTRAEVGQIELAREVFAGLEDAVRETASRLTRTHAEWFRRPIPANRLAGELVVERVRIPPDVKDATVYLRHAAFSGHTVEVALSLKGRVTYVGLLG